MSLAAQVRAIFQAEVGNTAIRYVTHPQDAVGVAVADDAAWDQIIAATVITDGFHHLAGLGMYHVGSAADFEEQVEEGIGGADGAATAAATTLVSVALASDFTATTAAAERVLKYQPWMLPVPIRVEQATDRHAMRISDSDTGGQALVASINVITGMGN